MAGEEVFDWHFFAALELDTQDLDVAIAAGNVDHSSFFVNDANIDFVVAVVWLVLGYPAVSDF